MYRQTKELNISGSLQDCAELLGENMRSQFTDQPYLQSLTATHILIDCRSTDGFNLWHHIIKKYDHSQVSEWAYHMLHMRDRKLKVSGRVKLLFCFNHFIKARLSFRGTLRWLKIYYDNK